VFQLIQNYKTGELELPDVPIPRVSNNAVCIQTQASLISIGTERSLIELGKKSLLGKAKARPDLVKRFIDKAKKEGLLKTFQEAMGRLDAPTPLGYSASGIVREVGNYVHSFSVGDRVACIGAGFATHAEYNTVPEPLCCKVPDNVSFEEAAFGMLGVISLHGIRCADLTFGERVSVIGLGLLGLITAQILKAYGSSVIGYDIDPRKVELARKLGIDFACSSEEEYKTLVDRNTEGYGADAVIITAASDSDAPVRLAVDIVRFRGKIVVVGVADIHPNRNELWYKEAQIIVSRAGGPGSLDPLFEQKGIDYPPGYVRWTEERNLQEFLRLISEGRVDVKSLITHQFPIQQVIEVYNNILNNTGGPYIGVVLKYGANSKETKEEALDRRKSLRPPINRVSNVTLGVLGAGLFGKALLIPALERVSKKEKAKLHTLVTSSGINAYHTAKKHGFETCSTDSKDIFQQKDINAVCILTPHSTHAKLVREALQENKHVFVEKPLCVTQQELEEITETYRTINFQEKPFLMVGYNRRFSPHSRKVKAFLQNRKDPLMIHYRVNAGFVPKTHWVHSEEEGGSRIIGEICHFVDLMIFFNGSYPEKVYAERVSGNDKTIVNDDNVAIILKFKDGSIGSIFYSASGDKAFSRERIEVFCEGKTFCIEDFKKTFLYLGGNKETYRTLNQEIGYEEELTHFFKVIKGEQNPCLNYEEIYYSTLCLFKIKESLQKGTEITL